VRFEKMSNILLDLPQLPPSYDRRGYRTVVKALLSGEWSTTNRISMLSYLSAKQAGHYLAVLRRIGVVEERRSVFGREWRLKVG